MVGVLVGTPVTTVYRDKTPHTILGKVVTADPSSTCLEVQLSEPMGPAHLFNAPRPRRYDREGITWIRGHHAPESEEAQALLAAWMLTMDGGPPP